MYCFYGNGAAEIRSTGVCNNTYQSVTPAFRSPTPVRVRQNSKMQRLAQLVDALVHARVDRSDHQPLGVWHFVLQDRWCGHTALGATPLRLHGGPTHVPVHGSYSQYLSGTVALRTAVSMVTL